MNLVLKILARIGLVVTIVPSFIYLFGSMELAEVKATMITGTIMWLVFAPVIQKQSQEQ
ncbi:MAG: hypothetical protein O7C75_09895 [Verrucomicrobia bacterium]|nr:hypothetical protein [Verrucomicrobiota bacterium]